MKSKFICTAELLTIIHNGQIHKYRIPDNMHIILPLLMNGEFDNALNIINNKEYLIEVLTNGIVKCDTDSGKFKIGHDILPDSVQSIIDRFVKEKKPIDPLLNLCTRLQNLPESMTDREKNITKTSVFDYLVNSSIHLLDNGCFIGYKAVESNYKDKHSGKFDNTPGNIVSMNRNLCTVDRNTACASGLHVGTLKYVTENYHDGKIVEVMVDPKDVVSVPFDYKNQKMRCCRYKVIRDVTSMVHNHTMSFDYVMYDGYVDPIDETKYVKSVSLKSSQDVVRVAAKELNSKPTNMDKVVLIATFTRMLEKIAYKKSIKITGKPTKQSPEKILSKFDVKLISEDKLPITKTIFKNTKFKIGDTLGIFINATSIVIDSKKKHSNFELKMHSDGSIRISKTILLKLGKLKKTYHVFVKSKNNHAYIVIEK